MKLAEVFKGFQGEGPTTGRSALFIRFLGCNLSCDLCDSKFSWKGGELETIDISKKRLYNYIDDCDRVVFTGGEPLLKNNLKIIEDIIDKYGLTKNYEIETNGVILPEYHKLCELYRKKVQFNVSPKGNIEQEKNSSTFPYLLDFMVSNYDWLSYKIKNYIIIKVLIENDDDFEYIEKLKKNYNLLNEQIWVQPKGAEAEKIKSIIKKHEQKILDCNYNVSNRLHIFLFGNKKGK